MSSATTASSSSSSLLIEFQKDPITFVRKLSEDSSSVVPSIDICSFLSHKNFVTYLQQDKSSPQEASSTTITLSNVYLQAMSRHLTALIMMKNDIQSQQQQSSSSHNNNNNNNNNQAGSLLNQQQQQQQQNNNKNNNNTEMQNSFILHDIGEGLKYAAARCQPKSIIVESGILTALFQLLPDNNNNNIYNKATSLLYTGPSLVPLHADLLALYLYAATTNDDNNNNNKDDGTTTDIINNDLMKDVESLLYETWPRPSPRTGCGMIVVGTATTINSSSSSNMASGSGSGGSNNNNNNLTNTNATTTGMGTEDSSDAAILTVLRYYYWRGCIHLLTGSNNNNNNKKIKCWDWARRCFWTVLGGIPAEVNSAFYVASWKKLIILQTLELLFSSSLCNQEEGLLSNHEMAITAIFRTPKTMPVCVTRLINQALQNNNRTTTTTTAMMEDSTTTSGGGGGSKGTSQQEQQQEYDDVAMMMGTVIPDDIHAPHGSLNKSQPPLLHADEPFVKLSSFDEMSLSSSSGNNNDNNNDFGMRIYADLVKAFVKVDTVAFQQHLRDGQNIFKADGNYQLVQHLEREWVRRQLYQWSQVFSVISINHLAKLLSMDVIELQNIFNPASLNNNNNNNNHYDLSFELKTKQIVMENGMVHFPKQPSMVVAQEMKENVTTSTSAAAASTTTVWEQQQQQNQERLEEDLIHLTSMIKKLDTTLTTSTKFISLLRKDTAATGEGEGQVIGRSAGAG